MDVRLLIVIMLMPFYALVPFLSWILLSIMN